MYVLTDTPEIGDETCYLNQSCLGSMSCGSLDMAWSTDSELEAIGMERLAYERGRKTLYVNEI